MDWCKLMIGITETAIYSLVGIIMMGIGFLLIKLFTPFSIKKEIEDDQNTSLGIIIGAIIIGISIIVAAVISSPSSVGTSSCPYMEKKADVQPVIEQKK